MAEVKSVSEGLMSRLGLDRPMSAPVLAGEARLLPGDRVPNFRLPGPDGALREFYSLAKGRPMVLVLAANTGKQDQWDEIKAFAAALTELETAGIDLVIVSNDGVDSLAIVSQTIPAPAAWFADIQGAVNIGLRSAAKFDMTGIISLLLDADQRLIALRGAGSGHAAWALATAWELPQPEPRELDAVAPVLLMPAVLDGAYRRRLVEQLDAGGVGAEGASIGESEFAVDVARVVLRRVGPEVDKAFSFDDFAIRDLKLRRDEAGAEAAVERRRDIVDINNAERSFTLLLDLDAGSYEGGGFAFPEYGPHLYRPGSGGVLVFSGALLAEIRPLSSGRRSLLTAVLRRKAKPAKEKAAG